MPFYKEYSIKIGTKPRKIIGHRRIKENEEILLATNALTSTDIQAVYFIALAENLGEVRVYHEVLDVNLKSVTRVLEQTQIAGPGYYQDFPAGLLSLLPVPIDTTIVGEESKGEK